MIARIKNRHTGEIMLGGVSLDVVIERHMKWVNSEEGGERADLRNADLRNADLRNADLRDTNLRDADLRNADLRDTNLRDAYLLDADLRNADLRNAYLQSAYLRNADLRNADLRNADLWGAYLLDANLQDADLHGVKGNKTQVKSLHLDSYDIAYTSGFMQIGCERHALEDWWSLTDEEIEKMDKGALKWWKKWKPVLQNIIEISPAKPNRNEKLLIELEYYQKCLTEQN